MNKFPKKVQGLLKQASSSKRASHKTFRCQTFGVEWNQFVENWAPKCYDFVAEALGGYQKEPLPEILAVSDAQHAAGVNAAFSPVSGQIWLHPSSAEGRAGTTLEKLTHELVHAALADFPEGDPFYEEGFVDYSVWVMAHAPFWGEHRESMIAAAEYNILARRERAIKTHAEYDAKRWAGAVYCSVAHGPWIIWKLREAKSEGRLRW